MAAPRSAGSWLERPQWGTGANIETKYLFASKRLRNLGCHARRVQDRRPQSPRSRRAPRHRRDLRRIFRKHMVLPDSIRDSAWYAIVDDDWPRVKVLLERKIERQASLGS